jgi:serine/threonine protein kinase
LIDLLKVLDYVHQHQLVHRDVKPENIIQRSEDQRYVLIDFGAVKELNIVEQIPDALVVGTAGYRSPEHIRGEPCFSSDIYALGITAIQLLTRTHPQYLPRTADHQLSWREKAMVTPELASIIDRMICPQVADRYQSAQSVITDLQCLPDPVAPSAEILAPQSQLNHRWKALLLVTLCAATILGAAGIYCSQQQPKSLIQQQG